MPPPPWACEQSKHLGLDRVKEIPNTYRFWLIFILEKNVFHLCHFYWCRLYNGKMCMSFTLMSMQYSNVLPNISLNEIWSGRRACMVLLVWGIDLKIQTFKVWIYCQIEWKVIRLSTCIAWKMRYEKHNTYCTWVIPWSWGTKCDMLNNAILIILFIVCRLYICIETIHFPGNFVPFRLNFYEVIE